MAILTIVQSRIDHLLTTTYEKYVCNFSASTKPFSHLLARKYLHFRELPWNNSMSYDKIRHIRIVYSFTK